MRCVTLLCSLSLVASASPGLAQIVPPKPGGALPAAYFERVSSDETAFQFRNAWIHKAERIKQERHRYLANTPVRPMQLNALPNDVKRSIIVSGTAYVPVFLAKYANTGASPYPAGDLQQELFDGPWPTGTMAELYAEMSGGNLLLTGTVYDWVTLQENDTYYEGGCNGLCATAKTGQLILEILTAADPSVDFGLYDNDGPDGIPNSGDDDGYVDFIAFVHPEIGGECITSNMWSHRWVVQAWPEFPGPWETNDSRAGGGVIRVQDYTIQPALGCGGSMIEIGVFAHEFGHAFGLPDLYDTDGGGLGIGHHGLMATGSWNTPSNPAHMSAWSKMELGWVLPIEVGPLEQTYTIDNVNQTGQVYQLNVVEEKFSRKSFGAIDGSYSLHCGLTDAEAASRNWRGAGGYGNKWKEAVRRDFSYDGTNPVTMQYDVSYDMEVAFDFARTRIEVNGTVSTLRNYTGTGAESGVVVDLTPHLSGSGATSYRIIAEFNSGSSRSDEDGDYDSGAGGPFVLDNISVTGGGENYTTDFEQSEDGWYYDFSENPHKEFFLVENRSRVGQFDQALLAEGLYIWHIEQNVIRSRFGNSGGTSNTTDLLPAGVMLEEADGLRHLLLGVNAGDAGDACPGEANSRTFDNTTGPSSRSHNGSATQVLVGEIGDPAPQMTARMRAGYFPPTVAAVTPNSGDTNAVVAISDLAGAGFVRGATFLLRDLNLSEFPASSAVWVGKNKMAGDIDLTGVPEGTYDVVVRNPDGQEAVLAGGFQVTARVPVFVKEIHVQTLGASVELTWDIWADEVILGFHILRRDAATAVDAVVNTAPIAPITRRFVDDSTRPERTYQYTLLILLADGASLRSRTVEVTTSRYAAQLHQNAPNPFNPSTRIRFELPERAHARLAIYDAAGRRVATLVDDVRDAGVNEVVWNGTDDSGAPAASGVYFYRLRTQGHTLTRKLLLLK